MKALTIKQPWASLIAHDIKDIENRTWKTNFRGRIYIHASAKSVGKMKDILSPSQYETVLSSGWKPSTNKPLSAIIGEVEIVDCVINYPSIWSEKTFTYETDETGEKPIGKPIYNWVLSNAILYEKPILNVKGKLSFWVPDIEIVECIGCGQKFDYDTMKTDDAEEKYCIECWNELSPLFAKESIECKHEHITRSDGLDECLDCGTRNY